MEWKKEVEKHRGLAEAHAISLDEVAESAHVITTLQAIVVAMEAERQAFAVKTKKDTSKQKDRVLTLLNGLKHLDSQAMRIQRMKEQLVYRRLEAESLKQQNEELKKQLEEYKNGKHD